MKLASVLGLCLTVLVALVAAGVWIVTDALVTNTGTEATCGAAINRAGGTGAAVTTPTATTAIGTTTTPSTTATTSGTASAGVPTLAGTLTQTDSTITGPLCVAARTTTPLPLTTGIEFGPGQTVQLMNVPDATTATGTAATGTAATATAGAVGFHLRGMLVAG